MHYRHFTMMPRGSRLGVAIVAVAAVAVGCDSSMCAESGRGVHLTLVETLHRLDESAAATFDIVGGTCAVVSTASAPVEVCEFNDQEARDAYVSSQESEGTGIATADWLMTFSSTNPDDATRVRDTAVPQRDNC